MDMDRVKREMAAFDRLPRQARAALAASPFNLPAGALAADMRRHRVPRSAAARFVAGFEDWARGQQNDEVVLAGNRIVARTLPDVAAIAAAAKL